MRHHQVIMALIMGISLSLPMPSTAQSGDASAAAKAQGQSPAPAEPCPRQPLPSPIDAAGFGEDTGAIDTVRFGIANQAQRIAYAVRFRRGNAYIPAKVDVVQLVSQLTCNRYDIQNRAHFTLSEAEASAYADRIRALEAARINQPPRIELNEGPFIYYRRFAPNYAISVRFGVIGTKGPEFDMSALFLCLARRGEAAAWLPDNASWIDQRPSNGPGVQKRMADTRVTCPASAAG